MHRDIVGTVYMLKYAHQTVKCCWYIAMYPYSRRQLFIRHLCGAKKNLQRRRDFLWGSGRLLVAAYFILSLLRWATWCAIVPICWAYRFKEKSHKSLRSMKIYHIFTYMLFYAYAAIGECLYGLYMRICTLDHKTHRQRCNVIVSSRLAQRLKGFTKWSFNIWKS